MPTRFPIEVGLRDARRVIVRAFNERHVDATFDFFQRLPEEVRRYAWDRLDIREVVNSWATDLDHDREVPVVALDGSKVVAHASLMYRDGGPLRLVGRIKWLLDPEYRGAGLGRMVVNTFMQMARDNGLRHLTCMLITDLEVDAVKTLRDLGFDEYPIANYGTDPDGNPRDMVKMVLAL
ncbi:MAG: GNAT family N-acetyltransferase [Planctomycetota bacterium]